MTTAQQRIRELKDAVSTYTPGSTFRFARQRPSDPPSVLRVGLFGPTGVGKSALINSINYATGERWDHQAPEGFATSASKTLVRDAFDVAECITLVDNRGMTSFGGEFMVEVGHQVAGVYGDGQQVEWDVGFFRRLVSGLERAWRSKKDCEIHCAVLVVSAVILGLKAQDLQELIETIKKITGQPPIVVITHRNDPAVRNDLLSSFKTGLQQLRIDFVFEVENYTTGNHQYDEGKHMMMLEILNQCTIVGDRVMKHKEDQGGCTIL